MNPVKASGSVFMNPGHCVGAAFILLLHNA